MDSEGNVLLDDGPRLESGEVIITGEKLKSSNMGLTMGCDLMAKKYQSSDVGSRDLVLWAPVRKEAVLHGDKEVGPISVGLVDPSWSNFYKLVSILFEPNQQMKVVQLKVVLSLVDSMQENYANVGRGDGVDERIDPLSSTGVVCMESVADKQVVREVVRSRQSLMISFLVYCPYVWSCPHSRSDDFFLDVKVG
ncbi:hypothetical protein Dimus_036249 [Dionaea muscipula]